MKIHLIAIGEKMPAWVNSGFKEYAGRMPRECKLVLHDVSAGRRTKNADIARLVRAEGAKALAAVPKGARIVALDVNGQAFNTEQMAAELKAQLARGADLALLVGGPEGLSDECLARADAKWSLSRLTLAHPLVRVVVAEQIYRAWSILKNLPYHRS